MKVANAVVCAECDEIYAINDEQCPTCGAEQRLSLGKVLGMKQSTDARLTCRTVAKYKPRRCWATGDLSEEGGSEIAETD